MRSWKKWLLSFGAVLLAVAGIAVLTGWTLSANITGERLQRVLASPQYGDGAFVNPEPQAPTEVTWDFLREQFLGDQQREPPGPIPVVSLSPDRLRQPPAAGLRAIWLGHASTLVEIDGQRILTDPVLSQRASPFSFVGPERFHPSPIPLDQLTGIDAVVISHNHYDHLDEETIRHLSGQGTRFLVPLGVGTHLEDWDIPRDQIIELDWWENHAIGALTITATPNRHYSGRGLFDYKATLWASWSIIGPRHRVFYSGDSGYSELFRRIGERFGPFDLNIIKIGSYGPTQSWADIHMTPEDAVRVHLDVGGKRMLPVHWATFNLAIHDWDEPVERALAAAQQNGVDLVTPKPGEIVIDGRPFENTPWWRQVR